MQLSGKKFFGSNFITANPTGVLQQVKALSVSRGQFPEICAQLLRSAPNLLTVFSGEEVEHQKMFLALNFFTRKRSQKDERQVKKLRRSFKKLTP